MCATEPVLWRSVQRGRGRVSRVLRLGRELCWLLLGILRSQWGVRSWRVSRRRL